MVEIVELKSLSESQALDVHALMGGELVPGLSVFAERLVALVEASGTHFFAAVRAVATATTLTFIGIKHPPQC